MRLGIYRFSDYGSEPGSNNCNNCFSAQVVFENSVVDITIGIAVLLLVLFWSDNKY